MIEGAGLYKTFKKELDKIGTIKSAWFTTFNLNITFFEQWILPMITKVDFNQAKTLRDYEEMNDLLTDTKDRLGIDVRVFYDYRAIKNQNETKRTSISLHPINVETFSADGNTNFFKGGVFHPKVCLIQNEQGRYFLMAASANLTLSGWARNRECFFFSEIQGKNNARKIGDFFDQIITGFDFALNNQIIKELTGGRGWGDNPKWAFVSSATDYFEDELKKQVAISKDKCLTIWSPYWSLELKALLNQLKDNGFEKIRLVPSKNESGLIAITKSIYEDCSSIDGVSFEEEKWGAVERPLIHAKVWMTDNAISIGSWNMTRPGSNIQKSRKRTEDNKNNFEAGIIVEINRSEYKELNDSAGFRKLVDHGFKTAQEIEKERKDILEPFEFPFVITADWTKGVYELMNPKLIPVELLDATVNLPDNKSIKLKSFLTPIKFNTYGSSLLNNRFFSVKLKEKLIFHGFINEIGLEHRPINEFDSEMDLLMSWINGVPEDRPDLIKKRITQEEDETADRDETKSLDFFLVKPWFNNLHGFARIRENIIEAASYSRAEERKHALLRIGRLVPGSIAELRAKMIKRKEQYLLIEEKKRPSPVFLWFMIEETNHCINKFNECVKMHSDFDEEIDRLKNLDLKLFLAQQHGHEFNNDQLQEYIELISKTIKNGK